MQLYNMSHSFLAITFFITVSSVSWGQFVDRPERNHCRLGPDRRRCGPTFAPRWYFNPLKGECFIFKYGGCQGNRNNFLSREECLDKCGSPPPPPPPPPNGHPEPPPPVLSDDLMEAYVERCKAPADTGPCRARMNKWFYDPGKRHCYVFIYGGCGGNSNKYNSEEECMLKCAKTVGTTRLPPPYTRNGQREPGTRRGLSVEKRPVRPPPRRQQDRRSTFFRTFFPLIWQVSIPKNSNRSPKVIPGSPKPQLRTTGVVIPQEMTTALNIQETTTQPPESKIQASSKDIKPVQVSTTPPARLEEEASVENAINDNESSTDEEQNEDYDDEITPTDEEEENSAELIGEDTMQMESQEQSWKTSDEDDKNSAEVGNDLPDEEEINTEDNNEENGTPEEPNENEPQNDETDKLNDRLEENDLGEDKPRFKTFEGPEDENDQEQDGQDEMTGMNRKRPNPPVIRFLFKSPIISKRPIFRKMYKPTPFRRPDYKKYYGPPRDMFNNRKLEYFRKFRPLDRPKYRMPFRRFDLNRGRKDRYWRERNRSPKKGITFTQVFVNKPSFNPMTHRQPLIPPHFHAPYVKPYPSIPVFRYPGLSTYKSFSLYGKQQSGSAPQIYGTYQSSRWPTNGPQTQIRVKILSGTNGEPNLACTHPPAVRRCMFAVPSSFWFYDGPRGKCVPYYFAGCSYTLNRFASRQECETTCMVTSPKPEITTETKQQPEQSTTKSTDPVQEVEEKPVAESKELKTTTPDIEPMFVKENAAANEISSEKQDMENTIELSKTHKVHIIHELAGKDKLTTMDKNTELEYVMVVGIVCLSGIALLILVSLGLMYMFKKFHGSTVEKPLPKPKKETVIEAVLKAHLQGNSMPKIACPVPLGPPPQSSSL